MKKGRLRDGFAIGPVIIRGPLLPAQPIRRTRAESALRVFTRAAGPIQPTPIPLWAGLREAPSGWAKNCLLAGH